VKSALVPKPFDDAALRAVMSHGRARALTLMIRGYWRSNVVAMAETHDE